MEMVLNHRRHYSSLSLVVVRQQLLRRVLLNFPLDPLPRARPRELEGRGAGHRRIRTRMSRPLLPSLSSRSNRRRNNSSSSSSNTKNCLRTNLRLCITTEVPLNSIIITLLTIIKDGCILANLRSMPTLTNSNSKLPLRQSRKSRQLQEEGANGDLPKHQARLRVLVSG